MQRRRTRSGIIKVALRAEAALALTSLILKTSHRSSTDAFVSHSIDPATDYETAMAHFAQVQALEEADGTINPVCFSKLLTHGSKTERVIILMQGMTNCPQ